MEIQDEKRRQLTGAERPGIDEFGACWGVAKRMDECVHYFIGEVPKLGLNVEK